MGQAEQEIQPQKQYHKLLSVGHSTSQKEISVREEKKSKWNSLEFSFCLGEKWVDYERRARVGISKRMWHTFVICGTCSRMRS